MRRLIFLISILLLFASCEKVIDLNLKDAAPVIVIEGEVINGTLTQEVRISRTVSFSDTSIFNPVSSADVTITTGNGHVYHLFEQFKGSYITNNLEGIPGETYTLSVKVDSAEYTATSTMPSFVAPDSIKTAITTFGKEKQNMVSVYYLDPEDETNYYRFKLFVHNSQSKNIFVFNDDFTNGNVVSRDLTDFDLEIKSGDRVEVQMECIDQNMYRYWSGVDQNQNRGGASTTPANPVSNLSNGALGYFSAHTAVSRMVRFP